MSESYRISSFDDLARVFDLLRDMPNDGSKIVTISDYSKDRSLAQNGLAFKWYTELGKHTGNGKEYERQRCKLTRGIPILRRDDQEFNKYYKFSLINLTYEQKLEAMEFVPVTRVMSTKQFAEYLDLIDKEAAHNGYLLTRPEDMYYEALGIKQTNAP